MPIVWKYLLSHFLRVFFFCVIAFIGLLLTMRLDEIAHFAALGAPIRYIAQFALYQIPYILPIAIPISCLISAVLLIQRLSSTHELTALRSCGFSIRDILTPILLTAALIGILNLFIVSEVATRTHFTSNLLKSEIRSVNPLLLLHNKHIMRMKGIYFESMGASRVGEFASKVILAVPNHNQNKINLMLAENLKSSSSAFIGTNVTLISSVSSNDPEKFDHLIIENMAKASTSVSDFSQLLQKKVLTINNDYLTMPLLLVRAREERSFIKEAKMHHLPSEVIKKHTVSLNKSLSEIARRISVAVAVITFTLMGAAFGMSISRKSQKRGIFFVIVLASIYLVSFFMAKGMDQNLVLSALLYGIPHLLILFASIYMLWRLSKGME